MRSRIRTAVSLFAGWCCVSGACSYCTTDYSRAVCKCAGPLQKIRRRSSKREAKLSHLARAFTSSIPCPARHSKLFFPPMCAWLERYDTTTRQGMRSVRPRPLISSL